MTTPTTPLIEGQALPEDFDLTDPLHVQCADGKVYELRGIRTIGFDLTDASMTCMGVADSVDVTFSIKFEDGVGVFDATQRNRT